MRTCRALFLIIRRALTTGAGSILVAVLGTVTLSVSAQQKAPEQAADARLEQAEAIAQTDAQRAIELSTAVLEQATRRADTPRQASARRVLAIAHYFQADFPRALENAVVAERLFQALGDADSQASLLSLMGAIHGSSRQPTRALDMYGRALEVSRSTGAQKGEAIVLMNLGKTYYDLERYDESVRHYEQSIARFETLLAAGEEVRPDAVLFARMGIADAFLRQGKPQQTIERAKVVLDASDPQSLVYQNALAILGEAHIDSGDFETAETYLQRALDEAQRTKRPAKRVETMSLMARLAQERGEFEEALALQRAVNDVNLDIYDERNSTELARLESRYENSLRDQQLALQESQLQRNRSIIVAISTVAAAALLLALILFKLYRVKQRAHQELRVLAETDPLTGLLNRRTMYEALRAISANTSEVSLCLLDIDNFKAINDQHGHTVGDQVLVAVAETISDNLRTNDKVCRWGGEEFLVLLVDRPLEDSVAVAQRLCDQVAAIELGHLNITHITASFGVAHFTPDTSDAEIIQRADAAMYRAKLDGKNRVSVFSSGS